MNTKHPVKTIVPRAALAAALALAPTAQADVVQFTGDAASQQNLAGRDVLAAVNFYDPFRAQSYPVGAIQGVDFDDFRTNVDDTGLPIALSAGVAGATLSTVIAQSEGREFEGAAGSGGANETQIGSFSPQNADNIEAERLANGGAYYQSGSTPASMTFAFGSGYANTAVEVQMLGGGIWGFAVTSAATHATQIDVSVGAGGTLATIEDRGYNMQLHTFEATTDGSGNLQLDLLQSPTPPATNHRYNIIAGITVTVAGSSSQPFAITAIDYAPDTGGLTLTWHSRPNETYSVYLSTDLIDWNWDLDDSIPADADETTTTAIFDLNADFPEGIPESVSFRVKKN